MEALLNAAVVGSEGSHPATIRPELLVAYARVEHGVKEVGDQIEQHDEAAAHHQAGQHDVHVRCLDPLYEQFPHAVPGEHLLDHDDTAKDSSRVYGHDRHSGASEVRRACSTVTRHRASPLAFAIRR